MQLTIITINYNNAAGLQKTLQSVLGQTTQNFEYIVVDGGSNDDSCDVMRNNQLVINGKIQLNGLNVKCISEKDSGIYNAMNKGIRLAQGEYVQFLNSGDWLVDSQVVQTMLEKMDEQKALTANGTDNPKIDILVGNVIAVGPKGERRYKKNAKHVSLYTFYCGTIEHTSAYIRRELFQQYGLYDETLRIVSDWKWYLQVAGLHKANVQFDDTYVSCFDTTGISSTQLQLDKAERRKVLEELVPAPILSDYDDHAFEIDQMQRLKKYPLLYKMVWLLERVLFKIEKLLRNVPIF